MQVIERIQDTPALATITDTRTLQQQVIFLEGWRRLEQERAQVTTGAIRAGCLAQLKRIDKEIARNKRFLVNRSG